MKMRKAMAAAAVVLIGLMWQAAHAAEGANPFDPEQLYKDLGPSVVTVTAVETVPRGAVNRTVDLLNPTKLPGNVLMFAFYPLIAVVNGPLKASGSGVIIDESGLFITNWHVVEGSNVFWATMQDGTLVRARVLRSDEMYDIALLQMELKPGQKVKAAPLGDSDAAVVGEPVVAIGSPLLLKHTESRGIVSGLNRRIVGPYQDFIQTDLFIGSGSSGGPLFNAKGEVIGLTTRVFADMGHTGGISLSVPINVVKDSLPEMKAGKRVVRGFVGAYIVTLTPRVAEEMKLTAPTREGAIVKVIEEQPFGGSPFKEAGLRRGDVVVKWGEKKIDSGHALARAVLTAKPGTQVKVEFYRGADLRTATVDVGER